MNCHYFTFYMNEIYNVKNEACLSHSPNTFLQMGAIIWIGEIIDGSIEKNI